MEPGSAAEEPHAVTACDLVVGYIDALNAVGMAMRAAITPLERLGDMLTSARSHRIIGRSGEVGPYSYQVHGVGCLFISDNGTEIDVDFTADGREIFDFWRLRCYGQSLPEPHVVTEQDLRSAVESLKPPLVEVRPGWFSAAQARLQHESDASADSR
ncbi:hypothetical protein MBT84_00195 [Streptomyces sp. MBT84]|uniref:DUF6896 domain-containing protein n=1 Tax=unclassified Streptomyces TaxID=2593676 RepID=UPI001C6ED7AA|nr:hypothetical protein [Streptomyces sp. MBT84]MBW8697978.1 hypothetical protein [Streptomyces sp. MBT84]